MARFLKGLGLALAGFFACLIMPNVLLHFGKHSDADRFGYFFMSLLAAPVVALVFIIIYFLSTERGSGRRSKSGRRWTGFDFLRLLLPTLLAAAISYGTFFVISKFADESDHGGTWMAPLVANTEGFVLAPMAGIVTFLLVYYVMVLFKPKVTESGISS